MSCKTYSIDYTDWYKDQGILIFTAGLVGLVGWLIIAAPIPTISPDKIGSLYLLWLCRKFFYLIGIMGIFLNIFGLLIYFWPKTTNKQKYLSCIRDSLYRCIVG